MFSGESRRTAPRGSWRQLSPPADCYNDAMLNFDDPSQLVPQTALDLPDNLGIITDWATSRGVLTGTEATPVGEAILIADSMGIIVNPDGQSSLQLRELQAEYRENGRVLYYVYPWDKRAEKLLSHFESKLGMDDRKFAAKRLRIEVIDNNAGNAFMRDNHIQGVAGGAGKVSIALTEKNTGEILAVQQFSRYRYGTKKGKGAVSESPVWEGLRLCFKPGVQIHGGASRLQRFFEKNFDPERIISYVSASHSTGLYKLAQGFTDITDWNQLSYMWVLEGEPQVVPIINRHGETKVNDLDIARKNRVISPSNINGAFGKGVGITFYGSKLGSRTSLRSYPENGTNTNNEAILQSIGYRQVHTAGQYKWEKNYRENPAN